MIEEEKKRKLLRLLLIAIAIVVILLLVNYFLTASKTKQVESPKNEQNQNYVTTAETKRVGTSNLYSRRPVINISSSDVARLNENIRQDYKEVTSDNYAQYTYQYAVSKDYLSIALFSNKTTEDSTYPYTEIKTYTVRLKNNSYVSDAELYQDFSISEKELASHFEKVMKQYYKEEVKKGILYEPECNYECFLKVRGVNSYLENINLFVKDNKLMYYRPFTVVTVFGDETFYEDKKEDFLFSLGEE